jgi:hypothetical protein
VQSGSTGIPTSLTGIPSRFGGKPSQKKGKADAKKMVLRSEINENFDMSYAHINVKDQTKATMT